MARLVINHDITSGRRLTLGQVLQLGGFSVGAHTAIEPTAPPAIAQHHLRIGLEHSEKMDPTDISSLNELLDRIAALGLSTDYDRIRLKPADHSPGGSRRGTRQEHFFPQVKNQLCSGLRTH